MKTEISMFKQYGISRCYDAMIHTHNCVLKIRKGHRTVSTNVTDLMNSLMVFPIPDAT